MKLLFINHTMPMTTILDRVGIYKEEPQSFQSQKHFDHVVLLGQFEVLDLLYLYYHKIYGHQTWQGSDLPWEAYNHKVKKRFEHVVTQGQVLN